MTAARALEAAARAIGDGTIAWTPDAAQGVRDTVDDLRALVDGSEPDDERADRIRCAIDRWRQPGVRFPDRPPMGPAGAATAFEHAGPLGGAEAMPVYAETRACIEFHAYAAAEVWDPEHGRGGVAPAGDRAP